ncbi:hypothetical protein M405DRAFT_855478 [Rhizopogon salebrosus TDB-379]|nr:hypothetical protein M405DRAFT_855478 [Rhizopogon salebrosus TDB-379]
MTHHQPPSYLLCPTTNFLHSGAATHLHLPPVSSNILPSYIMPSHTLHPSCALLYHPKHSWHLLAPSHSFYYLLHPLAALWHLLTPSTTSYTISQHLKPSQHLLTPSLHPFAPSLRPSHSHSRRNLIDSSLNPMSVSLV